MNFAPVRQPSAFVPVVMSLGAIATIIVHLALHGTAPQPDEGAAAHLWQLLMAGQIPFIVYHAIKWLPRDAKVATMVLAVQAAAGLAAAAPIFILRW